MDTKQVATICVHYWPIEPNNGLESKGVCKLCGEMQMFPNVCMIGNYTRALQQAGMRNRIVASKTSAIKS